MLQHVDTDCLLTPLSCPYHDLGCNGKVYSCIISLFMLFSSAIVFSFDEPGSRDSREQGWLSGESARLSRK